MRRRDGFMDLVRAASLLIVVVGHWLGVVPHLEDGVISGLMVYDVDPRYWITTWIFDVLPLFFFVGGFSNALSYRRLREAGRTSEFLWHRLFRLLAPTLVLLGAWVAVEALMAVFDLGGPGPLRGMRWGFMTPIAPLWFIGVYLIVVALVPLTLPLHERFGVAVPVAMLAGVVAVDCLAFGTGHRNLLGLNIVLAWLLPSQLGYFYADGRLQRLSPRAWAGAIAVLVVALAVTTSLPWYGRNMLDNGVLIIGVTAPTLPYALLFVLAVAIAMALRPYLVGLVGRPRVSAAVARLTGVSMTVFLWHMTAYFATVALLGAAGARLPATPDVTWWLERPLFALLPAALLVPLVWAFGRFERAPRHAQPREVPASS